MKNKHFVELAIKNEEKVDIRINPETQEVSSVRFYKFGYCPHSKKYPAKISLRKGIIFAEEWYLEGKPYERETGEPNYIVYYDNGNVCREEWLNAEQNRYSRYSIYQTRENNKPNYITYYPNGNKEETILYSWQSQVKRVLYREDGTIKYLFTGDISIDFDENGKIFSKTKTYSQEDVTDITYFYDKTGKVIKEEIDSSLPF